MAIQREISWATSGERQRGHRRRCRWFSALLPSNFAQKSRFQWLFPSVTVLKLVLFGAFLLKWSTLCISCGSERFLNIFQTFVWPRICFWTFFARVMLMITWWTMWRKCRTLRGSSAENKWDPKNVFRDLVRTRMDINRDESLRFRHSWPLEIFGFESDEFWNFSNYVITWSTIDWHWLTSISPRDAKLSLWTNKGSTSAQAK